MHRSAQTNAMTGALWEGDSKWEVTQQGHLTPCSLKRLCLSYIAEHLGSVTIIRPQDPRTSICYKDPKSKSKSGAHASDRTEASSSGVGKAACDEKDLLVYTRGNNFSCSETAGQTVNTSACSENSYISGRSSCNQGIQNVISYSVFNVPNNGRVYDKCDSIDPPGDVKERVQIFKKHQFSFIFR